MPDNRKPRQPHLLTDRPQNTDLVEDVTRVWFLRLISANFKMMHSTWHSFLVHLSRRLKCTIVIIRRPSSVRPSSLTFHIFDLFSETAEWNSTKLDRKQYLNVLYQVCVFGPIRKTRWPPWPLNG